MKFSPGGAFNAAVNLSDEIGTKFFSPLVKKAVSVKPKTIAKAATLGTAAVLGANFAHEMYDVGVNQAILGSPGATGALMQASAVGQLKTAIAGRPGDPYYPEVDMGKIWSPEEWKRNNNKYAPDGNVVLGMWNLR